MLTDRTDHRDHNERRHGQQVCSAGTKAVSTPGIGEHAHGHGRQKAGGQPVHLILSQLELHHDGRNGHIDNGGCQHHRHGAQHHGDGGQPPVAGPVTVEQLFDLGFNVGH